jgi:hypothetical protein
MTTPDLVLELVNRFRDHEEEYRRPSFNEAQTRIQFLDPLFELLGWDMQNKQGYAEAYKEVVHEDALNTAAGHKAPDYGFRIGGVRKFFLEAKKPSIPIATDVDSAYQVRRYAWSAKLPLSILSNFAELAVYDCRIRPTQGDKPSVARTLHFSYDELPERWNEFATIFSKDSILKGSFDKYALAGKGKRGTSEVDDEFLKEIERWREALAKNIALRNGKLTPRELNYAVQQTIDRIIFLRIAEDRGIESYGRLQALLNGGKTYERLVELFRDADDRYNSGLFHFQAERGRAHPPDQLTLDLSIDDKALKDILRNLYYPESPYAFSVLPVDILGQVYEQFLGKVIRLTASGQARIEEKPEVKKAGGVYYTPTYIVDHVVRGTVGKLIEGKTASYVAGGAKGGHPLRVLDPACGSGSFLLGAFQHLLNWYRAAYAANDPALLAKGRNPKLYKAGADDWRLTTAERKRILLDHIYGVDIDPQAVEVTKLSLLLKVLEGESRETIHKTYEMFHQRALPDLDDNIKCGNSLIGPEFYQGRLDLDQDERLRVNAFSWKSEFPDIFKTSGGFDAIVGNPPYVRIQMMKEWAPLEVEYYKRQYTSASSGNYDIYVVFVERALQLLAKHGRAGYILPNKFLTAEYAEPLRKILSTEKAVGEILSFGDQQVFEGATTYTCLLYFGPSTEKTFAFTQVRDLPAWRLASKAEHASVPISSLSDGPWILTAGPGAGLVRRLRDDFTTLEEAAEIFVGVQTSADAIFILEEVSQSARIVRLRSRALQKEVELERTLIRPLVSGVDVKSYATLPHRQWIIFPYGISDSSVALIPFEEIRTSCPKTAAYLEANRRNLEDRERGAGHGERWYGYIYLKNMARQSLPKVCVPRLVDVLHAAIDEQGSHCLDNVDVGGVTWRENYSRLTSFSLLALLNSALWRWYFPNVSAPFRGGFWSANRQFLGHLPVPKQPHNDKTYRAMVELDRLARRRQDLSRRREATRTPAEQAVWVRDAKAVEDSIDEVVFGIYGVTGDERDTLRRCCEQHPV